MRVDKFLKVSRLIKRRTVAKSAAEGNRVSVNGKTVKPGYVLKTGDEVSVAFGGGTVKVKVLSLDERSARNADGLYEVISQ